MAVLVLLCGQATCEFRMTLFLVVTAAPRETNQWEHSGNELPHSVALLLHVSVFAQQNHAK